MNSMSGAQGAIDAGALKQQREAMDIAKKDYVNRNISDERNTSATTGGKFNATSNNYSFNTQMPAMQQQLAQPPAPMPQFQVQRPMQVAQQQAPPQQQIAPPQQRQPAQTNRNPINIGNGVGTGTGAGTGNLYQSYGGDRSQGYTGYTAHTPGGQKWMVGNVEVKNFGS